MKTIKTLLLLLFISISLAAQSDQKAVKLLAGAEEAAGTWNKLYALHDVSYTYDYHYAGTEKRDLSTERYIFEGEHSWAKYTQHDINVAPGQKGNVTQSYVDGKPYIMTGDGMMTDPQLVGITEFLRKANYFWFTMFYKMRDQGVIATYKGKEKLAGINYEVVNVTYDAEVTGKAQNDEYIFYINPKTKLVDRFFFSLPAMGVDAPVILMELDYTTIDGVTIATKRRIYQPGADGKRSTTPNLVQTLTNVKFNNGFEKADFMLGK